MCIYKICIRPAKIVCKRKSQLTGSPNLLRTKWETGNHHVMWRVWAVCLLTGCWYALLRMQPPGEKDVSQQSHHMIDSTFRLIHLTTVLYMYMYIYIHIYIYTYIYIYSNRVELYGPGQGRHPSFRNQSLPPEKLLK